MKKWQWSLIVAAIVALGLWELRVFPDPYYHQEQVNIYTWIYREVDELIHGEKA